MPKTPMNKEAIVLKLLAEGDAMLCLDARRPGVRVPPEHAGNHALRLVLNLNFPRPIEVTADGISASLSFGGRRFACYIPMTALWAAYHPQTKEGMLWPDSMPPEVLAELAAQQQQGETSDLGPVASPPATAETAPKVGRQRGHLRLIK